jgi:hypothetical protein
MEFEPVTDGAIKHPSSRTGKQMIYWTWQHKLREGVLSHYLQSLKASKNKVAYEREHEILKLNSKRDSMALNVPPSPLKNDQDHTKMLLSNG